jgi:23S rRNA (pseudouridine1915-N3)-methyltransferase
VKINLIAIGKKMPDWIQTGITHYQKQLPSELNFTLTTPEAQKRKGLNEVELGLIIPIIGEPAV